MSISHIIGNPDSSIWKMLGIDDSKTTDAEQKSMDSSKKKIKNEKSKLTTCDNDDKISK